MLMREPASGGTGKELAEPLRRDLRRGRPACACESTGQHAGVPVICLGNLTVGGAGKTPAALAVAHLLHAAHERPFFLSRGYGGQLAGPVRVNPALHRAADVGDEPLLLARLAPTIVARDRVAGAKFAQFAGASVIVMDDGFQNASLAKDLAILVVDGRRGIGNGRIIPAGPLRAPLGLQLDRAQALIVVGPPDGAAAVIERARRHGVTIFHARLEPDRERDRRDRPAQSPGLRRHRRSEEILRDARPRPASTLPNAQAFPITTVTRRRKRRI